MEVSLGGGAENQAPFIGGKMSVKPVSVKNAAIYVFASILANYISPNQASPQE